MIANTSPRGEEFSAHHMRLKERCPGTIPRPLDAAVEKAWGYASERGRHLKEGNAPTHEEVELVVGIAATVATYLSRKK